MHLLLTTFVHESTQSVTVHFSLPQRILCETVKDFVAKVEKAQDRTLENAVVAEAVASKVRGDASRACELFIAITSTELCRKDCLGVLLPKYLKRKKQRFYLGMRIYKNTF